VRTTNISSVQTFGRPAGRADASRSASGHTVAAATLLLFLLAAFPILHSKVPALGDYINHLARMYVIADGERDPLLSRFYGVEWKLLPNLAMDLIVPPFVDVVGIYWAGRLFVLLYMALILGGVQAVHYALFRRLSLGPLAAVLFLYSISSAVGLLNYLFGLGLALWGFAAWIGLRQAHPVLRLFVACGFVLALFLCHLAALGIYGEAVLGFEAWCWRRAEALSPHIIDGIGERRQPGPYRVCDLAVLVLPFLLVPVLLAASPTGEAALRNTVVWSLAAKGRGVWQVARIYSQDYDLATALLIGGCAIWAQRRGWVRLHPAGWFVLAVAVPVYLAVPTDMMSSVGVDMRLPLGIVLIVAGCLAWNLPTAARRRAFLAVLGVLALLRVAGVEAAFERMNGVTADFERSLALIPRGSRVLIAKVAAPLRRDPLMDTLEFLPCLAIIERGSLVSLEFSHPAQQVLTVKPPYRTIAGGYDDAPPTVEELLRPPEQSPNAPSGRIYWADWPRTYDYVYVFLTSAETPNPAPDRLRLVYEGRGFQLYQIHSAPNSAS